MDYFRLEDEFRYEGLVVSAEAKLSSVANYRASSKVVVVKRNENRPLDFGHSRGSQAIYYLSFLGSRENSRRVQLILFEL